MEDSPMKKIASPFAKNQEIFIGLEDSKRSWKLNVRTNDMCIDRVSMPAEFCKLKNYIKKHYENCNVFLMYEAGFRGFNLYDKLESIGVTCIVTPPHTVVEDKVNKQKNDTNDAKLLARNLEKGIYKSCHIPDKELRADRQVVRLYTANKKDINRTKNRIRRFAELNDLEIFTDQKQWTDKRYKEFKTYALKEVKETSIKFTLEEYYEQLEALWEQKKRIVTRLEELSEKERYSKYVNLFMTVPGIGKLHAIRLVIEWGDLSRFKSQAEISHFTGFSPSDYSTGESDRKGHITHMGNERVRQILLQAAWVLVRKDHFMTARFIQLTKNTASKKKAIVAIARKLAIVLWAMWRNEKEYQIGFSAV